MPTPLKMVLPKGRLQEKVLDLLSRAGLTFSVNNRSYRPIASDPDVEVKLLKAQNIAQLIALGRHDCGFTGLDWLTEARLAMPDAQVTELLDLGYDKVRIVAAVPEALVEGDAWRKRSIVIASEYQQLCQDFVRKNNLDAVLIKTSGATEALPPEDADMIIDNTATGTTLQMNRLAIVDELMLSTTRFVCNTDVMADPWKREKLETLVMLMKSVIVADSRVLLEMNVSTEAFESLVTQLPAMRSPTVSPLYGETGFAVKVSVPAKEVAALLPKLVALGARDILEYRLEKIVL